jgi:hypothetical protein
MILYDVIRTSENLGCIDNIRIFAVFIRRYSD